MSVPYFYAKGSYMSALLKADYAKHRAANPQRYMSRKVTETRQDGTGKQTTVIVNAEPDAVPMTPKQRHLFATRKY